MKPTREQLAVIRHKEGHARVLAVAGAGKTTTMALRIIHLVEKKKISPKRVRVLMFNRLASRQFNEKLGLLGSREGQRPFISTFHSFSYQFVQKAIHEGYLDVNAFWTGKNDQVRVHLLRSIQELEKRGTIPEDSVDVETAREAIGLWKGSLIPPARAGHLVSPYLHNVYTHFEAVRVSNKAMTYDDFVPAVIHLLRDHESLQQQWCGRVDHLIVDEYQDVNLAQQTLVELLAGAHADVMVVGDDDQTIYEWRGARPDYMLRHFEEVFHGKPHIVYTLSHSFRFGNGIASAAARTIRNNRNRYEKELLAHYKRKKSEIHVLEARQSNPVSVHHDMAVVVKKLIEKKGVNPSEIWVLGRMYSQLSIFESQCLAVGIPYRVLGGDPFFKRTEVQKLLDYLRVVLAFHEPLSGAVKRSFERIVNTPNRFLQRRMITDTLTIAENQSWSVRAYLEMLQNGAYVELDKKQRQHVSDLHWVLGKAHAYAAGSSRQGQGVIRNAGKLLKWILVQVDYEDHFRNYYGEGEDAFERMETLRNFTDFATSLDLEATAFLERMKHLDATQGAKASAQITMTTIHKTKGLEFDYVFIPSCQEGYMPCLFDTPIATYDTDNPEHTAPHSASIESERRLFYVAITRARKAVYIGTSHPPSLQVGHAGGGETSEEISSSMPSRFISEIGV